MGRFRADKGFSLIELMVVIGLIAVIGAFAVPSMVHQSNEKKLREAVSTLRGDLENARSRAIRENAPVAVVFNSDGYSIFIENGAIANRDNGVRDGDEQPVCSRSFRAGIRIDMSSVTFANHRTHFTGRGYVGNGGVLRLQNQEGAQVTVNMNNRFGRITIS